jgi:hypothetical protein
MQLPQSSAGSRPIHLIVLVYYTFWNLQLLPIACCYFSEMLWVGKNKNNGRACQRSDYRNTTGSQILHDWWSKAVFPAQRAYINDL